MTHRRDPVRISRRAALGAAAAAGATLGTPGRVLAGTDPADPTATDGPVNDPWFVPSSDDVPQIAPAPTAAGTRYVSLAGIDFTPNTDGATHSSPQGQLRSASAIGYSAHVALPGGARITEMVVYATRPDLDSTVVRLVCHRSSLAGNSAFVVVAQIDTTASVPSPLVRAHVTAVTPTANGATVDEDASSYFVLVNPPGDATHELWGVRIGYVTADAGRFFPIDPVRVYDSRAAAPEPGILAPNTSRVVLVRDGRANASGAVVAPNVVPAGATAVACNLTVTGTTGPNFLALTPGDSAAFTASAINWSGADQSVANGLIATLDNNRFVKVWCGDQSGSTHVILDVSGYWL